MRRTVLVAAALAAASLLAYAAVSVGERPKAPRQPAPTALRPHPPAMTVSRFLTLDPDGVLLLRVWPDGRSSSIRVDGPARLGGALRVVPAPGNYPAQPAFRVLVADTVEGRFDSVSVEGPGVSAEVDYQPTGVVVRLVPTR